MFRVGSCWGRDLYVANGRVSFNKPEVRRNFYDLGTVASFTCNSGYSREGSSSSTCQNSGMWSSQAPTCKKSNVLIHSISKMYRDWYYYSFVILV